jgi:xylulokinase
VRAALGIDLGTSYFKAGLFSEGGEQLGLGKAAVEAGTAVDGRFELEAPRFRALLAAVIGQALASASLSPREIAAVSYSSQANTFLLLDAAARPLTPLILWQDRRVQEVPPTLKGFHARPDFLSMTGLDIMGPLQCTSKLLWLREHTPGIHGRARMLMTASDYLTFLLTDERAGDSGTACLLGLWDLPGGRWWGEALDVVEIPQGMLSRLARPGTVVGRTGGQAEELFCLPRGIPVAVGSLDHHMAAVGCGLGAVSSVLESTGTVVACLAESQRYTPRPRCAMGPGVPGAAPYYSVAFHDSGAVVLEWYRNRYAKDLGFDELAALAQEVPAGSQGLVCLPLADTYPGKDGFRGAGALHGHGHFTRAIMESIAGQLALLLTHLCGEALPACVLSSGGASRSALWLQIKADITGCSMLTTAYPEAACAGAAMMAAAAAGWFATPIQASSSWVRVQKTVRPDPAGRRLYEELRRQGRGQGAG